MSKILIVAEHDGAQAQSPARSKCVTCAAKVAGRHRSTSRCSPRTAAAVAAQAAAHRRRRQGAASSTTPANAEPLAAVLAPQVAKLAAGYTHVFGPSTTFGKDLMPRVAALLGVGPGAATSWRSKARTLQAADLRGQRDPHGRSARRTRKVVATVRVASFEAAATGGSAAVEKVGPRRRPALAHALRLALRRHDGPPGPAVSASRVVSGGRALGSAENFKLIYSLADKLGAAVGASRAAVDAGYVPNDLQVGQTGKIIAPELYFAIGISGAIQHMTGIKDARTIVAINKDGEAPIFEAADIGLVGDLFAIVPELEKQLG